MKYQIYRFIGTLITLTALSAAAQAQSVSRAHVPFDFSVKNKILAAGEYQMSRISQQAISVTKMDTNNPVAMILTTGYGLNRGVDNKWIFRRYGTSYFLSAVCIDGSTIDVPKSKTEKSLLKELARERLARNDYSPVIPEILAMAVFEN